MARSNSSVLFLFFTLALFGSRLSVAMEKCHQGVVEGGKPGTLKAGTVPAELWGLPISWGYFPFTQTLPDGRWLVATDDGMVRWISTGNEIQHSFDRGQMTRAKGLHRSEPLVLPGGVVILGTASGPVYWVKDGKKVASFDPGTSCLSNPFSVPKGDLLGASTSKGAVYWFTAEGRVLGQAQLPERVSSSRFGGTTTDTYRRPTVEELGVVVVSASRDPRRDPSPEKRWLITPTPGRVIPLDSPR